MDESTQGILILIVISILSASVWHSFINKKTAHIGAVITSAILFQIANYIYVGYIDPFFVIAIIFSSAIALVVSFVVKAIIVKFKKYKQA